MVIRIGCLVLALACLASRPTSGEESSSGEESLRDRSKTAADTLRIEGLVVVLVDESTVAAPIEGSVLDVLFTEGEFVRAGDVLVQLDDHQAKIEESLAAAALVIAQTRRDQTEAIDAAAAAVAEQERLIAEQTVRSERAEAQADNKLKISAAEKAEAVALNEYNRAQTAKRSFDDAISDSEIESLRLSHERSRLETREAIFQNQMNALDVRLDQAVAATLRQKLESARVALRAANSTQEIRGVEAEMQRLNHELARAALAQRRLRSTIDGTIVSLRAKSGDWLRPGQTVARVIGLNRLRAEGFAEAGDAQLLRDAREIRIIVTSADDEMITCRSTARFVSPEIDAVTNEVRFWVEFENEPERILPGSKARVEIDL